MKKLSNKNISFEAFLMAFCCIFALLLLTGGGAAQHRGTQTARVEIGQYGYEPAAIRLQKGVRARITFLRRTDDTCATEVLFPDYGIRRDLPLDRQIVITLIPRSAGEFRFTCGMNMHRGKVIVRQ